MSDESMSWAYMRHKESETFTEISGGFPLGRVGTFLRRTPLPGLPHSASSQKKNRCQPQDKIIPRPNLVARGDQEGPGPLPNCEESLNTEPCRCSVIGRSPAGTRKVTAQWGARGGTSHDTKGMNGMVLGESEDRSWLQRNME